MIIDHVTLTYFI